MRVLSSEPPLFMPHPRELVEAGPSPPQPNCSTWVERQIPFKTHSLSRYSTARRRNPNGAERRE